MDHLSDVVLNGITRAIRPLPDRDPTVFFFGFQCQEAARFLAETELEVVFEKTDSNVVLDCPSAVVVLLGLVDPSLNPEERLVERVNDTKCPFLIPGRQIKRPESAIDGPSPALVRQPEIPVLALRSSLLTGLGETLHYCQRNRFRGSKLSFHDQLACIAGKRLDRSASQEMKRSPIGEQLI